jgi:hypothetical protein
VIGSLIRGVLLIVKLTGAGDVGSIQPMEHVLEILVASGKPILFQVGQVHGVLINLTSAGRQAQSPLVVV